MSSEDEGREEGEDERSGVDVLRSVRGKTSPSV